MTVAEMDYKIDCMAAVRASLLELVAQRAADRVAQ